MEGAYPAVAENRARAAHELGGFPRAGAKRVAAFFVDAFEAREVRVAHRRADGGGAVPPRAQAGPTLPAAGLCLEHVEYDVDWPGTGVE